MQLYWVRWHETKPYPQCGIHGGLTLSLLKKLWMEPRASWLGSRRWWTWQREVLLGVSCSTVVTSCLHETEGERTESREPWEKITECLLEEYALFCSNQQERAEGSGVQSGHLGDTSRGYLRSHTVYRAEPWASWKDWDFAPWSTIQGKVRGRISRKGNFLLSDPFSVQLPLPPDPRPRAWLTLTTENVWWDFQF